MAHLQKANTLGLPRALRRDADDLEAKLSYAAEKGAKKKAFLDKLVNFKTRLMASLFSVVVIALQTEIRALPNTTISCR